MKHSPLSPPRKQYQLTAASGGNRYCLRGGGSGNCFTPDTDLLVSQNPKGELQYGKQNGWQSAIGQSNRQRARGNRQNAEGEIQKVKKLSAESKRQKARGKRQKANGTRQRARTQVGTSNWMCGAWKTYCKQWFSYVFLEKHFLMPWKGFV